MLLIIVSSGNVNIHLKRKNIPIAIPNTTNVINNDSNTFINVFIIYPFSP